MTALTILIRVAQLGGSALVVGAFGFLVVVARPAFGNGGAQARHALDRFDRRLLGLAAASLALALGASLVGLWVQTAAVVDRPLLAALAPRALGGVLAGTRYGQVWLARLGLALLLAGLLAAARRRRAAGPGEPRGWWGLRVAGLALATAMLAAFAWAGHAAAAEGQALVFQVAADVVHLIAAGTWLGGLPCLARLLAWAGRTAGPGAAAVAADATRRFSVVALVAVGLLVHSGLASAWAQVGSVPALVGTLYGRLLLLKMTLLLPLLALAAANLLREKPRLVRAAAEEGGAGAAAVVRRLRRNVLAEAALGAAILVVVGWLGTVPPARHDQPTWPFSFRVSTDALQGLVRLPGVGSRVVTGANIVLWSLLAFGFAALSRTRRVTAAALGVAGLALGGWVLWPVKPLVVVDAYPTTYLRPAVPYHALSVASGLGLYRTHCAVCHGAAGHGDGPAAGGLPMRPANLTAAHTAEHTAGDLFWWISHGIRGSPMPGFADRLGEEERWDLVNAVRILSDAEAARRLGPSAGGRPRIVAPDFTYATASGEAGSLRDFRGETVVLLVFFSLPASRDRLRDLDAAYEAIRRVGGEVLAVPLDEAGRTRSLPPEVAAGLPVVADGAAEAAATYVLFRRDWTPAGRPPDPPIPSHLEFLVDRQGYLRARWIPGREEGWADPARLLAEVARLAAEPLQGPVPAEHVH